MVRVSPTTPNMYILKWFRFIIAAKIYNILRYVLDHKLRHMFNLHIKETEISQKRSKGIKIWKITYSVILSDLSNKTNLILGFSSPLRIVNHSGHLHYIYIFLHEEFLAFTWRHFSFILDIEFQMVVNQGQKNNFRTRFKIIINT